MAEQIQGRETLESFTRFVTMDAATLRRDVINRLLNPDRNLYFECGYPNTLTTQDYKDLYDRLGLAARVVSLWSEECWNVEPTVYETEESKETEFEKQFNLLQKEQHWFHYLAKIDKLSGIGRYGVLLFGINDGQELNTPVQGINEKTGEKTGSTKRELLYLRAFDESLLEIKQNEKNKTSPRFGQPTEYTIVFEDKTGTETSQSKIQVHWTRLLHVADNRENSEVFGIPRMKDVFNHLLDMRKISGGSAEMFWKGGFPGYNFKVDPEIADIDLDTDTLKEQVRLYSEGLQRYMALVGVEVQSLQPQVADPRGHIESLVKLIAMSKGVPYRLLLGTEEAKLASTQDKETWNVRVAKRQNNYLTPMLIGPFLDRLIAFGVLPEPKEYQIDWPDLNAPTDKDLAEVALKRTEAYAKYVGGNVAQVIPPKEYHMQIQGMTEEEADAMEPAAGAFEATLEVDEEEEARRKAEEEEQEEE
jgi:hypothetical protein